MQKKMTQRMVMMGMFWGNDNNNVTDFLSEKFQIKSEIFLFFVDNLHEPSVPVALCNFWCRLPSDAIENFLMFWLGMHPLTN